MLPVIRNSFDQNWLPSIFNDLFDNSWMNRTNATAPAINVMESETDYRVEVAAPGLGKNDFQIRLNDNENLVITMEKKQETKDENPNKGQKRYLRREFSYSKFQQTLVLPDDVVREQITANMKDGVLTITLPKEKVEEKAPVDRLIEIQG